MRMWMVNPKTMCRQHLLGEHVELHMLVASLNAGRSVEGYTSTALVDLRKIHSRHAALVVEMNRRGMHHRSPLPAVTARMPRDLGGCSEKANELELHRRCTECRRLQAAAKVRVVKRAGKESR